jgi:zinc protease
MRIRSAFTAAALALVAATASAQVDDWREIETPALRSFEVQQPKRIQLGNGLVIFLQENHELPLVSGTAILRGGERDVPAPKAGLTDMYGQVWRTGGTATRTGDDLDDFLEMRAAKVETGADDDSSSISFNTLKGQLDPVFGVWADLLRNPEFRAEKIDLAKRQINTMIARRNDSPSAIAAREANRLLWGADTPYGRVVEYDTVAAVGRDDLVEFHRRFVHPNNLIIGISGDFDSKAMEARLRKAFGSWKRGPDAPAPEFTPQPSRGIFFVPKDDVTQSTIVLLHPGARKDDPEYHAIQVLNEVFGGGFSGRLMNRIRTEKGLAYSVGGGIGTEYDRPGRFLLNMGTKSESTLEAIESLYAEMENVRNSLVTQDEIGLARESLLNSFVFMLDSKEKVLNQRMTLEFHGYPADFLERYRAGIEKITAEDLQRVARKFIRPDELAVLVVGREADFDKPLSSRGDVTVIDITIPEPGASTAAPAAPVTTNDEGRALLDRMKTFLGGAAIDALRGIRTAADVQATTPAGPMQIGQTTTIDLTTGRVHRLMQTPMGEMQIALSDAGAFVRGPMGVQDLPASQSKAMRDELWIDPLYLARNAASGEVSVSRTGAEAVGDIQAARLEVDAAGTKVAFLIDPETGQPLRRIRTTMAMGQQAEEVAEFRDWKTEGGIRYASKLVITANGEQQAEATVTSIVLNPAIDEALFIK